MSHHFIRRGDVLLFRSASSLGRAVREGQRIPGQKYAPAVNHVGLVVRSGEPAREPYALIVEGASKVRRGTLYEHHADDFVWCYRPFLPAYDLEAIVRSVEGRVGEPYSVLEMLTQLADHKLFRGRVVARWLTRPIWGSQCSTLVAEEFERAGHPIAERASWACAPADIERYFLDRPGRYVCAWSGFPRDWRAA